MIETLLADDSPAFRAALAAVLGEAGGFRVVGGAQSGEEAVKLARELRPHLVVMDVVMPGLDGIEATARIMRDSPCAVVVMSSLMDAEAQTVVFRALEAGAVEALGKPKDLSQARARAQLVQSLRAMAQVKVVRRRGGPKDSRPPELEGAAEVLLIGASTGGPPALCEVLRHLPADCPPVLIAQHLAHGFVGGLARWLSDATSLEVCVVTDLPRPVRRGTVYLATDGHHLEFKDGAAHALPAPNDSPVPSVNRLFSSATGRANGVVALILTGMGGDGASGMLALRRAGAFTLAQDEGSSLVYGMPRVAKEAGAVSEELPLTVIGARLAELSSGSGS